MFNKISIVGFGAFGFAMCHHISNRLSANANHSSRIFVYDADEELLSYLERKRKHKYLLRKHTLGSNVKICHSEEELLDDTELIILCIPVQKMREFIRGISVKVPKSAYIMNCSKGIEHPTGKLVPDMISKDLGHNLSGRYAFLSGGMIASEFVEGKGTFCADIVSSNRTLRKRLRGLLESDTLAISERSDVRYSETLSALKNVIAIGAGILEGIGLSYSVRSTFIAAALEELESFAAQNADTKVNRSAPTTAFFGDYIMSTTGETRNRRLGNLIGKGKDPAHALEYMSSKGLTTEGYWTIAAIAKMLAQDKSKYPILWKIFEILHKGRSPADIRNFLG